MAEDKTKTTKTTEETAKKAPEKTTDESAAVATATTEPVARPKKAKAKRSVPVGQVHIRATFNNTLITVTDPKGNTISAASAGKLGFKGSKKGTAYAAQLASERALTTAKQSFGVSRVDVFVTGIGLGRDSAIRALMNTDIQVDSIKEETKEPHGGVRAKKPRRG